MGVFESNKVTAVGLCFSLLFGTVAIAQSGESPKSMASPDSTQAKSPRSEPPAILPQECKSVDLGLSIPTNELPAEGAILSFRKLASETCDRYFFSEVERDDKKALACALAHNNTAILSGLAALGRGVSQNLRLALSYM
jgi:hypothetical protein